MFRPENGSSRNGTAEAPFSTADLPKGQPVELGIFTDKYLVEVFADDRQAMVTSFAEYVGKADLEAFTIGAPTTLKTIKIGKLRPANQGFREAQKSRIWEPDKDWISVCWRSDRTHSHSRMRGN
jgi:beta-fructofuranosidase